MSTAYVTRRVASTAGSGQRTPVAQPNRSKSRIIDADVHSLTVHLAGTFTPTEQLGRLADEANSLLARLFRRTKAAGAVRADLQLNDLAMIFEQMAAIRLGDAERTRALRRRYLTLQLDAMRPHMAAARLPGTPPTSEELGQRWIPK